MDGCLRWNPNRIFALRQSLGVHDAKDQKRYQRDKQNCHPHLFEFYLCAAPNDPCLACEHHRRDDVESIAERDSIGGCPRIHHHLFCSQIHGIRKQEQQRRSSRLERFTIQNTGWGIPSTGTFTRFSFLRGSNSGGRDTSGRGTTMVSSGATYGADTETGTGTDVLSVLVSENALAFSEPPSQFEPSQSESAIETPNTDEILKDIQGIGLITDAFDTINDMTSTMYVVPKK